MAIKKRKEESRKKIPYRSNKEETTNKEKKEKIIAPIAPIAQEEGKPAEEQNTTNNECDQYNIRY
jgi:hypothetical protein